MEKICVTTKVKKFSYKNLQLVYNRIFWSTNWYKSRFLCLHVGIDSHFMYTKKVLLSSGNIYIINDALESQ